MSDEFVTKALSDLFVAQQEAIVHLKGIRRDLSLASREAKSASGAAQKASEAARLASEAADESRQALESMSEKFDASDEKMAGLEGFMVTQGDRFKDLIDIMQGFANRSANAEIWRSEAELRLTRLEEWVDKQDEAS